MTREATMRLRKALLARLREGGWQSGEQLAAGFGMSRAGLAKHVAALRRAGHVIEAASRRGYHLASEAEVFTLESIRAGLATRVIGQGEWRLFARSDSTNQQAAHLALEGAPEGSVVLAVTQQAGRARLGRAWHSPPGGVYVSVLLRPRLREQDTSLFTLLGVVAACEAMRAHGLAGAVVKWPNDVICQGGKLCGVLIEAGLIGGRLEWVVVGAGLNVDTQAADIPASLSGRATSLRMECGHPVSRAAVTRHFLERADAWYAQLRARGAEALIGRWQALKPPARA